MPLGLVVAWAMLSAIAPGSAVETAVTVSRVVVAAAWIAALTFAVMVGSVYLSEQYLRRALSYKALAGSSVLVLVSAGYRWQAVAVSACRRCWASSSRPEVWRSSRSPRCPEKPGHDHTMIPVGPGAGNGVRPLRRTTLPEDSRPFCQNPYEICISAELHRVRLAPVGKEQVLRTNAITLSSSRREPQATFTPLCHVLREDPALAEDIPLRERRARAADECIARGRVPPGAVDGMASARAPRKTASACGAEHGLLVRRVGVRGNFGAELELGDGDC